eukprot:CAMPEP_0183442158 /NCGR_PEP_ID=MMETSP0370-20130417/87221_1 /TAXON_ID=268820 /ORGANISM="Peridinium aciculiferum, Strain PAER-2" /LENGTH=40 /DNA_ID= /DNA_START= /DNA_END= /DNA_ORIENTATION=
MWAAAPRPRWQRRRGLRGGADLTKVVGRGWFGATHASGMY